MKRHPLSVVWGDMPPDQFQELVEDVQKHGVREPIVCHDELILDGWHRVRAAAKAEKTCKFIPLPEGEDPASFVIRRNAYRRHLTVSQRAAAVVACCEWNQQGGDRRSENFKRQSLPFENGGKKAPGLTMSEMAAKSGIGERTLRDAYAAKQAGLIGKVRSGKMSANVAARQARGKPSKPKQPTKIEKLEAEIGLLKAEVNRKADRIEELEEREAFLLDQDRPHEAARMATLNNQRQSIFTLRTQVGEWQTRHAELLRENRWLRKRLRAFEEDIRA